MTRLAELAIRLFHNHDCATDPRIDPDVYDWEDHAETIRDAFSLRDSEKDRLLLHCLDLALHFARTADAALGRDFSNTVIADWRGRGWEPNTERSGCVRATPVGPDPNGLSKSDREALWRSLLSDEPSHEPDDEQGRPRDSDAEVISIEALRRRRALRREEPWRV